jgi:hypothetical protein
VDVGVPSDAVRCKHKVLYSVQEYQGIKWKVAWLKHKEAAPEKPPCACSAARTHTTVSSDTVHFCRVASQYQCTLSHALRFLTETLHCANLRWHSGPLLWSTDGEYKRSTDKMCAVLSVLYKVNQQALAEWGLPANMVKRLALPSSHTLSSCCGCSVTVCVIALQHIISFTLLLQKGTSITLQATGDRWVSG